LIAGRTVVVRVRPFVNHLLTSFRQKSGVAYPGP
jgi:hypothetical protein